ncbi:MAG TPA: tetratricopeptide repeat protein [Chthonomonadaceae bacterium]|nr:tetratricopeptide repeat protein [Chthonomonadaceae bacterium]
MIPQQRSLAQRRLRFGGWLCVSVMALVGIYYFSHTGRQYWMNSLSVDTLKQEGARNPKDGELNFMLAHRLNQEGRLEEAFAVIQQLTREYPENAQYWLGMARCATDLARPVETVQAYRKALALNPGIAEAHMSLGQIYGEAGLVTDALEHFEQGNKLAPNADVNQEVWLRCLIAKKRYQEAWDKAVSLVKQNPRMAEIYEFVYTAGVPLGKSAEAEEVLYSGIGVVGSYHGSALKSGLARLLIAKQQDAKTLGTAAMLADEAARGQGARADDYAALGQVFSLENDLKGARSAAENGLKMDANDPACLKTLAEVAQRQGKKEEQTRLLARLSQRLEGGPEVVTQRKAVSAVPNDPKAHLALAAALEKEADYGAAAEECHEALKLAKDDATAKQQLEECRLKALEKLAKESAAKNVR